MHQMQNSIADLKKVILKKYEVYEYRVLVHRHRLTDNCTTSTLFHNRFIQFFTIIQQFNISIVAGW